MRPDSKKMVFPQEKDGFGKENQLFLRKKMVFLSVQKTSFGNLCGQSPKLWFFWVSPGRSWFSYPILSLGKSCFFCQNNLSPRKKLVFPCQNHFFPREKFVFLPKTIFILRKIWRKTNFFRGTTKTKHNFELWPHSFPIFCFCDFFWLSLGKGRFSFPKPSFSKEIVGFLLENHFFLRKTWYFTPRPSFS